MRPLFNTTVLGAAGATTLFAAGSNLAVYGMSISMPICTAAIAGTVGINFSFSAAGVGVLWFESMLSIRAAAATFDMPSPFRSIIFPQAIVLSRGAALTLNQSVSNLGGGFNVGINVWGESLI